MTTAMYDEHVLNNAKETDVNHNVVTNITVVEAPTNVEIQSSDGTNDTIAAADETNAGVMTTTMYDKLNGIEVSSDVTDTNNVTSAGALMDSEIDADLKTFALPASVTIGSYHSYLNTSTELAFQQAVNLEIGVDVQAYDADTAKTDVVQTWTAVQTIPSVKQLDNVITGTTPAISGGDGNVQTWALSGNSTPTDGMVDGDMIELWISDGTAYTITWTSLVNYYEGGSAPTLATTGYTKVILEKVDSDVYLTSIGDYS